MVLLIVGAACSGGRDRPGQAAGTTASPTTGSSPTTTTPGRDSVTALRVCGKRSYQENTQQCERDQRDQPIIDDTVYCTAMVKGSAGGMVRARWMFEGRQVFSGEVPTPSVEKPFKVDLTFGPNPLPGGSWRCEISGPASVSADFRGGGPRGPFLYPAACDSTRAVKMNNITPCAKDESAQPLTGVASASCSAVLTGVENREVRVEINFAGTFQAGPSRSSGYSTFGSGRPTGPVVEVDTAITAKEMTLRSGNLPPGPYVCRWLVDGNEVGTRTFTVK